MLNKLIIATLIWLLSSHAALVSAMTMQHGDMSMDESGMTMGENKDNIPKDCPKIAGEINIDIHAGHKHAQKLPGKMFAFDQQQWEVPGCTKINITFTNDDHIRHQLMIHGLPGYLYRDGMFTIELYGQGKKSASLIVSNDPKTYLVHCEVPQHMEKGMKAQLKVAGGDGDLPSIPGITDPFMLDSYMIDWNNQTWTILVTAILAGCISIFGLNKLKQKYSSSKSDL